VVARLVALPATPLLKRIEPRRVARLMRLSSPQGAQRAFFVGVPHRLQQDEPQARNRVWVAT
jgi:hypothetical protein